MVKWLLNLLPPWANPTLLAGVGGMLAGAVAAYFLAANIWSARLSASQNETAQTQMRYDGYKAGVAINAAQATGKALDERVALQGQVDALQTKLVEAQRIADAKSHALQAILARARPEDVRPLGPVARDYFDRLRGP